MDKKKSIKKVAADQPERLNSEVVSPATEPTQKEDGKKPASRKKAGETTSQITGIKSISDKENTNEPVIAKVKNAPTKKSLPETGIRVKKASSKIKNVAATAVAPKAMPAAKTKISAQDNAANLIRKISFQLKYSTIVGQSLFVSGSHDLLGNNDVEKAFPLTYLNNEYWYGILEIPEGNIFLEDVAYNYVLKNTDGTFTSDWGSNQLINANVRQAEELFLMDTWNDSSLIENTFFTEPFREVLLKENFTQNSSAASPANATHIFKVKAPLLGKGEVLMITGSAEKLGEWSIGNPVLLSSKKDEEWHHVSVDLSGADFPVAYKYGVFDTEKNRFVAYENGNNRVLYDGISPGKLTVVSDGFANISYKFFKGAGVAIPVFSLRSQNSFGVGEFTDLKLLVDWAKKTGLKLVQLLPVNDTTATHSYTDSYPYAAISAFALHPLYLHLPSVVSKENQAVLASLNEKQSTLNSFPVVNYTEVMAAKWDLLKQIFPSQKEHTFKSSDFHAFFVENAHWLVPYAAFSYFRETYDTSDFSQWPGHNQYDEAAINQLAGSPLKADEAISIYYYVQYHLHLQLKDATNYAHSHGIIVKGDIPIGIYRNSCDAWQQPELYNMDQQAGAPPDDFAVKGQNWGFPTYNWQRMKEDGFDWWKKRFKQMSYYFDAFRIDHILGFFRIWSIPLHAVEGILGHFVPAVPIHITEFHGRGIYFEYNRYCKPYITHSIIESIFGNETEEVKAKFLDWQSDVDQYSLKPEFETQLKVETYFTSQEQNEHSQKIKSGIFDLISNIILLEEEGSGRQQFHFRIAMESTTSFQHLDGNTQQQLRELYLNYFYNRQDEFWRKEAMQKLPELKRSTNMLICGEDLGMVPATVPGVMRELAILSLEIQRMPKDPKREFFHPNDAPYLSVVTPSTHDMSTIRGWWEEDSSKTQRFYNNILGHYGASPFFCSGSINRDIVIQHLYSPAMWSIFQLQDILGMSETLRRQNPSDERINIPSNPKHYWRYRMQMTLEDLINETAFNTAFKGYVSASGR